MLVYGELGESDILKIAYQVRDDLLNIPGISQVSLSGNRDREISIETDPERLRSYGLSIQQLSDAVRRSSIDLPAGAIRTAGGRLLLRTKSQAYSGDDFRNIIIRAADGAQLRLGDVATVNDGFSEGKAIMRYDGQRAMRIEVLRSGSESAIRISDAVRGYIDDAEAKYPDGVNFAIWDDESISLRGRLSTLVSSLAMGAVL
ncbi:MAG: efflux RND transporter permease subunit, partial [Akkermansiaceae bacterium]|nr:efflux RND transporter permease subunit [Akkermansiaceae bacterium]